MADSSENQGSVFDLDRIRELIELMKEHELSEVDLKQDEQQIRLSRGAQGGLVSVPAAVPAAAPAPQQAAPAPAAAAEASEENIAYITSPIVGTFYTKPNPNAESFVKVGDSVEPDTTALPGTEK